MTCGANVPLPPKPHTEVNPAGSSNQLIGTPAPREKADRKLLGTLRSGRYPTVNGRYGKGTMKIDPSFSGWETMAVFHTIFCSRRGTLAVGSPCVFQHLPAYLRGYPPVIEPGNETSPQHHPFLMFMPCLLMILP